MSEQYDAFRAEAQEKIRAAGFTSLQEWTEARPGEHVWAAWGDVTSCAACGNVRRADGKNSPCRGIARIGLRDGDADVVL
jgi:hypothetical protein